MGNRLLPGDGAGGDVAQDSCTAGGQAVVAGKEGSQLFAVRHEIVEGNGLFAVVTKENEFPAQAGERKGQVETGGDAATFKDDVSAAGLDCLNAFRQLVLGQASWVDSVLGAHLFGHFQPLGVEVDGDGDGTAQPRRGQGPESDESDGMEGDYVAHLDAGHVDGIVAHRRHDEEGGGCVIHVCGEMFDFGIFGHECVGRVGA